MRRWTRRRLASRIDLAQGGRCHSEWSRWLRRGAAKRDGRLRCADDQERQRDRCRGVELRERPAGRWRRYHPRGTRRSGAGAGRRGRRSPAGVARDPGRAGDPGRIRRFGLSPRGEEGLKAAPRKGRRDGAGDVRGGQGTAGRFYSSRRRRPGMARRIAVNAKVQRPGVCNAAETLLVDAAIAEDFVPAVLSKLREAGVELFQGDSGARWRSSASRRLAPPRCRTARPGTSTWRSAGGRGRTLEAKDRSRLNRHGSGHSEAIVGSIEQAAERFLAEVDTRAAVYVNAIYPLHRTASSSGWAPRSATRPRSCTPGEPIGVQELTTVKYLAHGDGQLRE